MKIVDVVLLTADKAMPSGDTYTSGCLERVVCDLRGKTIHITDSLYPSCLSKGVGVACNFRFKDNNLCCNVSISDKEWCKFDKDELSFFPGAAVSVIEHNRGIYTYKEVLYISIRSVDDFV